MLNAILLHEPFWGPVCAQITSSFWAGVGLLCAGLVLGFALGRIRVVDRV